MYEFLGTIGHLGVSIGLITLIILIVLNLKWMLGSAEKRMLTKKAHINKLSKKHDEVNLQKHSTLFTNIGISLALLAVLAVFEVPDLSHIGVADLGSLTDDAEEQIEIPPTEHKPPPPPKIRQPEIIEVPDEEDIEEDIEIDLDIEIDEETIIEEIRAEEPEEEEKADEIFQIVEEQAEPIGGHGAFRKYLSKNIKYPGQARRMGIEGKVYLQFVVEKNGSITDIKIIRGIGGGCDEEAKRVLEKAPKWKPGKQRGKPVRVRMVVPIIFKLG